MPRKPEALDYEGVFPGRVGRGRESDAQIEMWPSAGNVESFDKPAINDASPIKDEPANLSVLMKSENWIRRRGHTLSYFCLFLFSIVLYFRPYELVPALSSLTSMAFYTGLVTLIIYAVTQPVVEGNLTVRPREINLILLLGLAALVSIPMAIDPSEAWKTFNELLVKALLI